MGRERDGMGREKEGMGRIGERERKGEGERNKNPPSDRSGYGPGRYAVSLAIFCISRCLTQGAHETYKLRKCVC